MKFGAFIPQDIFLDFTLFWSRKVLSYISINCFTLLLCTSLLIIFGTTKVMLRQASQIYRAQEQGNKAIFLTEEMKGGDKTRKLENIFYRQVQPQSKTNCSCFGQITIFVDYFWYYIGGAEVDRSRAARQQYQFTY